MPAQLQRQQEHPSGQGAAFALFTRCPVEVSARSQGLARGD
ncbi:hypothetical protein [Hydrogenophaga taeniospiralis]|nr:hypothetical protein [Hydrogenophaga taeniospiralis]